MDTETAGVHACRVGIDSYRKDSEAWRSKADAAAHTAQEYAKLFGDGAAVTADDDAGDDGQDTEHVQSHGTAVSKGHGTNKSAAIRMQPPADTNAALHGIDAEVDAEVDKDRHRKNKSKKTDKTVEGETAVPLETGAQGVVKHPKKMHKQGAEAPLAAKHEQQPHDEQGVAQHHKAKKRDKHQASNGIGQHVDVAGLHVDSKTAEAMALLGFPAAAELPKQAKKRRKAKQST